MADKEKEDSITPRQWQDASLRVALSALLSHFAFRAVSLSFVGRGKIAAPYIQNKRLSESGPAERCDLRASTGDAIKRRIYRGAGARTLKRGKESEKK